MEIGIDSRNEKTTIVRWW